MIADTHEELINMVNMIGVDVKWIQDEGKYSEHFDICLSKKDLAIKNGALEITAKNLVRRMLQKKPILTVANTLDGIGLLQ
jgi:hypothetical protein